MVRFLLLFNIIFNTNGWQCVDRIAKKSLTFDRRGGELHRYNADALKVTFNRPGQVSVLPSKDVSDDLADWNMTVTIPCHVHFQILRRDLKTKI